MRGGRRGGWQGGKKEKNMGERGVGFAGNINSLTDAQVTLLPGHTCTSAPSPHSGAAWGSSSLGSPAPLLIPPAILLPPGVALRSSWTWSSTTRPKAMKKGLRCHSGVGGLGSHAWPHYLPHTFTFAHPPDPGAWATGST